MLSSDEFSLETDFFRLNAAPKATAALAPNIVNGSGTVLTSVVIELNEVDGGLAKTILFSISISCNSVFEKGRNCPLGSTGKGPVSDVLEMGSRNSVVLPEAPGGSSVKNWSFD